MVCLCLLTAHTYLFSIFCSSIQCFFLPLLPESLCLSYCFNKWIKKKIQRRKREGVAEFELTLNEMASKRLLLKLMKRSYASHFLHSSLSLVLSFSSTLHCPSISVPLSLIRYSCVKCEWARVKMTKCAIGHTNSNKFHLIYVLRFKAKWMNTRLDILTQT